MFKVFFLICSPGRTWERTAAAQRGYAYIMATYLLPFIALDVVAEGWSLIKNGKWQPHYQNTHTFTSTAVIHFEILQAALLLAMVFVSALLILVAAENFQGRNKYLPIFTTVAYGYSPLFLASLMNMSATMNPFVSWTLGIIISMGILYQGIPQVIKPDPTQAFGIYLSATLVMLLISGLVRVMTALYLLGRIDFQNSWLLQQIGAWLGQ